MPILTILPTLADMPDIPRSWSRHQKKQEIHKLFVPLYKWVRSREFECLIQRNMLLQLYHTNRCSIIFGRFLYSHWSKRSRKEPLQFLGSLGIRWKPYLFPENRHSLTGWNVYRWTVPSSCFSMRSLPSKNGQTSRVSARGQVVGPGKGLLMYYRMCWFIWWGHTCIRLDIFRRGLYNFPPGNDHISHPRYMHFWVDAFSLHFWWDMLPSLKLTAKAPENGWLEYDRFLLGMAHC